jgi:DNA helicase-2/ATP-dependent DNA helicase PcrA
VNEVDLFAEQHEVREAAQRNLYTGKAYNSLENISEFFQARGVPYPGGRPPRAQPRSASAPSSPGAGRIAPAGPGPAKVTGPAKVVPMPRSGGAGGTGRVVKGLSPGARVEHPKYGRGQVLRREGEGDDAKVTVMFPGHGIKKLVTRFAGLKIYE